MPASNSISRIRSPLAALVAFAVVMSLAAPAHAVLIQTVTGTDNTTAPADDPGFANVGYSTTGYGSAIYLGEGWVLTANHVGGGGIILGSGTYLEKAGTGFSLMTGTNYADMYMYKLQTTPVGLPTLPIASSTPAEGSDLTMIGGGLDRGAFTEWNVNTNTGTNPWIWTVTGSNGDAAGYGTVGSQAIRWGTNNVEWLDLDVKEYWGAGPNDYYRTLSQGSFFNNLRGTTEAQAVLHDSGGAVFTKVGGQWQLSGMIFAVAGYSGQPNPIYTAVFGDATLFADLSSYRPQIVAAIPEPSAAVLAGLAAITLGARWIRRRRHRR